MPLYITGYIQTLYMERYDHIQDAEDKSKVWGLLIIDTNGRKSDGQYMGSLYDVFRMPLPGVM